MGRTVIITDEDLRNILRSMDGSYTDTLDEDVINHTLKSVAVNDKILDKLYEDKLNDGTPMWTIPYGEQFNLRYTVCTECGCRFWVDYVNNGPITRTINMCPHCGDKDHIRSDHVVLFLRIREFEAR